MKPMANVLMKMLANGLLLYVFVTSCRTTAQLDSSTLDDTDLPKIEQVEGIGPALTDPATGIRMFCPQEKSSKECEVELYLNYYTNVFRQNAGRKPLIWDKRISLASSLWVNAQIVCSYTAHEGFTSGWRESDFETARHEQERKIEQEGLEVPDESKMASLLSDKMFLLGENSDFPFEGELGVSIDTSSSAFIAYQLVHRYWVSSGHKQQMLTASLTHFGASASRLANRNRWYSNQIFGKSIPAGVVSTPRHRPRCAAEQN